MTAATVARVIRSGFEESVHLGDVAVAEASGRLVAAAGDAARMVFARSSMKPLQAAVSLSLADAGFDDREAAVMCASHNGEPVHRDAALSILSRVGLDEAALRCPADVPWDRRSALAEPEPRPIHSNCSGKHAGMLAACVARGWELETYPAPDHPLQRRVLEAVRLAASVDDVPVGVDGCGVPVHALPLSAMATIYARLARPALLQDLGPSVERATSAMRREPYLVAGRHRLDTALMLRCAGVVAKGGAEGLRCAAVLDRGIGIAVKVRDGGSRAAAAALLRTLRLLGALDEEDEAALEPFARPPVLGGGRSVGEVRSDFVLDGRV